MSDSETDEISLLISLSRVPVPAVNDNSVQLPATTDGIVIHSARCPYLCFSASALQFLLLLFRRLVERVRVIVSRGAQRCATPPVVVVGPVVVAFCGITASANETTHR